MNAVTISESDYDNLARALGPEAWRLSPATFAFHASGHKWQPYKHLLHASTVVAQALLEGNQFIIISMPPRHGKSLTFARWLPIWILDRWPDWPIILCSYGADLAKRHSRFVRDQVNYLADKGVMRTRLREDATRVDEFLTEEEGGMIAAGVAGPITGSGAKVLIIDDYVKNAKDAASENLREDQWEWLTGTAIPRLEPGGSVIIIATRWNIDDIIGRIALDPAFAGKVKWITLPALADENDPIGRIPGQALCPERYDVDRLGTIRDLLGNYFWMAEYQQSPIPRSAGQVTRAMFQIVDQLPPKEKLVYVRAWDLAGSPEKGDFTVGVKMAVDTHSHYAYIVDVIRRQVSAHDLETLLYNTAVADGVECRIKIEQEPGSAGKIAIDYICRHILRGFNAIGEKSSGEKFVRAQPFFAYVQNGYVRLLRAHWNEGFISENIVFPDGRNDDQVDGASLAFATQFEKRYKGVVWGRGQSYDRVLQSLQRSGIILPPRLQQNIITASMSASANRTPAGLFVPAPMGPLPKQAFVHLSPTWGRRPGQ